MKKIDCYIIPPLSELGLMQKGDRYFCLAHLYLTSERYRNFFKWVHEKKEFITLDNSAAERSLVTEDKLIEVVKDLKPNEVVSPDILFDKEGTLKNLRSFIIRMKKEKLLGRTKIFACPQGSNRREWISCYVEMLKNKDVSVIGLSKISVPKCWMNAVEDQKIAESRNKAISYLDKNNLIKKPIHCLGMGDPREYRVYKHPLIRSTDSCYTVLAAYNGIDLSSEFKRIPTPKEYLDLYLTEKQIQLAYKNITFLKEQLGR